MSFRVVMGLPPARGNENPRRPREGGDPWSAGTKMDSRSPAFAEDKLRGNDVTFVGMTSPGVIFRRAERGILLCAGRDPGTKIRARFLAPLGMTPHFEGDRTLESDSENLSAWTNG